MTAIPDHIFRGYDIRGVAGKDLNEEVMSVLGQGYGTYIAQRRIKHAVVGGGCRLTTPAYQAAFIKGLTSTGVNVIDLGLGLSQTMYFSQYHYKTNGGATITASHNPKNYNGCKLALGYSSTLGTEEIIELKNLIKTGKFVLRWEKNARIWTVLPSPISSAKRPPSPKRYKKRSQSTPAC